MKKPNKVLQRTADKLCGPAVAELGSLLASIHTRQ